MDFRQFCLGPISIHGGLISTTRQAEAQLLETGAELAVAQQVRS